MSIILVLFFLFLSLHSCINARPLGVHEFYHSITKAKDEKLNGGHHVFTDQTERKHLVGETESKGKRSVKDEEDSAGEKMWRIPHSKREGEEAGFNLDYVPPKTHPPVHN